MKRFSVKLLAVILGLAILTGCGAKKKHNAKVFRDVVLRTTTTTEIEPTQTDDTPTTVYSDSNTSAPEDTEIIDYTFVGFAPNREIKDGNVIQEMIAQATGVRVKENWITYTSQDEAIGAMMASGQLPDFIEARSEIQQLYENDYLVPWDEFLEDPAYSELRSMYSDKQWELFRRDDGHIYWANAYGAQRGEPTARNYNGQAFWIQVRVLEEAGYPLIETLDDYFTLIEDFAKRHPKNEDGVDVIPYTAMCEGWRYYCVENAPYYLDGYPDDGSVIVNTDDPEHPKIEDYNITPTAKMYFKKLNEIAKSGLLDPGFASMNYDTYIAKLSSGAVLGMCDRHWDFSIIDDEFAAKGFDKLGYSYVPLGLVANRGQTKNKWHTYSSAVDTSTGIAVTTSCYDYQKAFAFLNSCLTQEIHDLRFWGIEGEDYYVDDTGSFYRTDDMRVKWQDADYLCEHSCVYPAFPQWNGTSVDGINAMKPSEQESEFFSSMPDPLKNAFEAYGYTSYCDWLRSEKDFEPGPWYPMYTYSNMMDTTTDYGLSWIKITDVKHEFLPKVIFAKDFEKEWQNYMDSYAACKPELFLNEMQAELERRMNNG